MQNNRPPHIVGDRSYFLRAGARCCSFEARTALRPRRHVRPAFFCNMSPPQKCHNFSTRRPQRACDPKLSAARRAASIPHGFTKKSPGGCAPWTNAKTSPLLLHRAQRGEDGASYSRVADAVRATFPTAAAPYFCFKTLQRELASPAVSLLTQV